MESKIRRTGIDVIGDVPWGTHFCQFYETGQDLIESSGAVFQGRPGLKRVLHVGNIRTSPGRSGDGSLAICSPGPGRLHRQRPD